MKKASTVLLTVFIMFVVLTLSACDTIFCKHDDPTQIEILEARDSTCSEIGLTEGMRCNHCGLMVVPQAAIPKLKCVESKWIVDKEATFYEDGKRHTECILCGKTLQEENLSINNAFESALPASKGNFTKMFISEVIDGVDSIYVADNGAGYVCVIGKEFIGVGEDGVALGESKNKAIAEAAIAIVASTELIDVNLTAFEGISSRIKSAQVTVTGNYVFVIEAEGHGLKGDEHTYPSGKPSVIKVSISADGVVIDSQTLENNETQTRGGSQLKDGAYNSNFIDKTEIEAKDVDTVAESTNTTKGYKQAILRCFEAFIILTGNYN